MISAGSDVDYGRAEYFQNYYLFSPLYQLNENIVHQGNLNKY